jgi:hypothetical protein
MYPGLTPFLTVTADRNAAHRIDMGSDTFAPGDCHSSSNLSMSEGGLTWFLKYTRLIFFHS